MRRRCLLGLAAAVALGTLASAQDAKDFERGKAVFAEQHCRVCHSVGGVGNAKGPLDGIGSKLKPAEIKEWLTNPKDQAAKAKAERTPPMISFKHLPPEDLDALVAYVGSLKK
jgi:mono/diheme cytochrome c family protein